MTVKLNKQAFEQAKTLIEQEKFVCDEKNMWSEHQPSVQDQDEYLQEHGIGEYGKWYLGIDTGEDEFTKARYKFPYGDFENVHYCEVLAAEIRAGQNKYDDIEQAAAHLHGMLDGAKREQGKRLLQLNE